jgi:SWI/SNF-related matrix-associated actin-dependent regulator 1 of chromatin subfamily A
MAQTGELLRLAARLKLRSVVNWVTEFLQNSDEKIVLFANHHACIDALRRRVPGPCVTVDGRVSMKDRQAAIDRFQRDPSCRVFLGQIQACSTGITLTAASTVAFAELVWRPSDHIQGEDRVHRIGQESTCWAYYLVAHGTIEERLCSVLQQKQAVVSSTLDGIAHDGNLNIMEMLLQELDNEAKA